MRTIGPRTTWVRAASLVLAVAAATAPAGAQTDEPPVRRLEVGIGGGWLGGAELGARDAELRQNGPGALRLFTSETRLAGAPALDVSVGYALNRRLTVEGGVMLSHPDLQSSISGDSEGAAAITVAERIDQYVVEGRLLVLLEEMRLGQRTVPFVSAGAGYLRQLHDGLTVVEEGHLYHVGGGLKYVLLARRGGFIRGAGLRADARLYFLLSGISFDDGPRPHGWISGAAYLTF